MTARARLTLPHSKGWVDFRDLDDISGGDYRKIRGARTDQIGEATNGITQAAAVALVAAWEIPGKDLPIPRRDPLAIEKLHYRDLYALERALAPLVNHIIDGTTDDEDAGSPPPPATD